MGHREATARLYPPLAYKIRYINLNSPSRACQVNCTSAPHVRVVRFKIVVRHVTLRSQSLTHYIRVPILLSLLTSQFSQPPLPQRQLHPVPPPMQPSRQSRRQLPPWQRFGKLRRGFLQLHFLSCSGYRRQSHLFKNKRYLRPRRLGDGHPA